MQTQNIPAADQVSKNKTIYDVSSFEVFWRNFVAGMGRAFGGLIMYVIVLVVLASLINQYLMPKITPLIGTLQDSVDSLNQLNSGPKDGVDQILNQPGLQNILKQVNP
ncbi:hypothetical protein ACFL1M_01605 [Patescibacteria group bacterium]